MGSSAGTGVAIVKKASMVNCKDENDVQMKDEFGECCCY